MAGHGREHSTPLPTRNARGGTTINIITAVVFFGLIALGIMWIMKTAGEAGEQYVTGMVRTHDKAAAVSCQMNLRSISQNLQMYAMSHEGFPDSQRELVDFCGNTRLFRCPDPNGAEYVYIPGQRSDMPATNVLVYESRAVHNGKCNVLFLGGRLAALTPEELRLALAATTAQR